MRRAFFLVFASLVMFSVQAATRRALVIGIGDYPAESGWTKIHGDRDIPVVKDMLAANGFDQQNIVELRNEQATCAAIKSEFEKLIAKATVGDYVYVHFSGHGQQITDLNGDEDDGLDEAWIAYDAQFAFAKGIYEGQNHLLDDQLNLYLHRLREKVGKGGKIVVIADACHSGSGSRGETDDEYVVRGTAEKFVIPFDAKKTTAKRTLFNTEWTFISACKPYQSNYEYKGNGSLTYALYQQHTNFSRLSAKQLCQRVGACIADIVPFIQTPMLEVSVDADGDMFL